MDFHRRRGVRVQLDLRSVQHRRRQAVAHAAMESIGDAAREDDRAPQMHAPARADLHDSPSDPYVLDTGVQHDRRTGCASLCREPQIERRAIQDRDVLPRTLKLGHRPVRGHDET